MNTEAADNQERGAQELVPDQALVSLYPVELTAGPPGYLPARERERERIRQEREGS